MERKALTSALNPSSEHSQAALMANKGSMDEEVITDPLAEWLWPPQ